MYVRGDYLQIRCKRDQNTNLRSGNFFENDESSTADEVLPIVQRRSIKKITMKWELKV